jgi:SAM-dependent methyltransferase
MDATSSPVDDAANMMELVADLAVRETRTLGPARRQKPIEPFLETADRHKEAGTRLVGPSRFGGVKKAFLRLARLYTVEQATFNQAVLSSLLELNTGLNELRADVDRRLATSQATLTSTQLTLDDARVAVDRLEDKLIEVRSVLGENAALRAVDRTELLALRSRVDMLLADARSRLPEPMDADELRAFTKEVEGWLDPLYLQLEDRFRGSREAIIELQKEYLPDVLDLTGGTAPVVDIGCGRGEWLELLRDNGIPAYGVDNNATFVEGNQARGLDVRLADAVEHLNTVDESSLGAVTGFHLAEHLPFPLLVQLVDAALRALRPGGVLILETPNPSNLVVGSSAFYIDPTHRNPLHPHFLDFLVTARGFVNVELRFLHPADDQVFVLPETGSAGDGTRLAFARIVEQLNWALFGPQDYAVLGRKAAAVPG